MRHLAFVLIFLAAPALAQDPPACDAAREGQTACLAGKLCLCRFERGGEMTGRPDRFAWDCGVLRPNCPPEPTIAPARRNLAPPGIWLAPGRAGPPRP